MEVNPITKKSNYELRSRQQWIVLLKEQKQSGLTIREFCKRYSLNISTYYSWKQKLLGKSEPQRNKAVRKKSGFSAVKLQSPEASKGIEVKFPSGIILRGNSREDGAWLKEIFQELGGLHHA
jgi:hypothetical protein